MMGALGGISSKTLANWMADPEDRFAKKTPQFHQLIELTQLARGVIKPDRLADWLHSPCEDFGGQTPAQLLLNPETLDQVIAVVRALKHSNLA